MFEALYPKTSDLGRVSMQIMRAPKGALFIVSARGDTVYPRALVEGLGRPDLEVIGWEALLDEDRLAEFGGRVFPAVILDIWLEERGLSGIALESYRKLQSQVRRDLYAEPPTEPPTIKRT